jgi:predicted ribonuclease YlaK
MFKRRKKNRRARRKSSVSNQNSAPTNKTNNRSAKKSTKLHQEDQEEAEDESDKLVDRVTLETALSKIQMEALTYIRGRSIMNKYVIVDECQNLTPHEVKTVISRAGEGTKMILTGDPLQIDNPYLDSNSNGLSYAVERLKFTPIHGHVTLRSSERSELAAVAAELL